ncbi:MAG: cytochrome ubiquinol oxidase subunit I [Thermoleophilia bacterium]|nr:cytochrome ubiquinol oxidase subunit I [Thermoleophilia bacterium]
MDALDLSRLQFAFTVGYHFIFVPFSMGLALMVVLAERRYYKSGVPAHRAASEFWIKLFTATFAIGVATGITMEFAFGANWADYSRFVGDIFGAPLAAEGLFAFFLESTFLGILLFGRKRVSRGFYYASAWLVLIGAHLSAVWILIANSWQHTPRGFAIEDGRAVLTSFWAAVFNPSTLPRLSHTVVATWVMGGFAIAAIAAWYLLKGRHVRLARSWMTTGLILGLVTAVAMPFVGHWHAVQVAEEQPIKMAAFESVWETESNSTLWLFGWVRDGGEEVVGLGIPSGLSLMLGLDPAHEVTGLSSVPPEDRPPVQLTFQAYHLMIGIGFLMIGLLALALIMHALGRLERSRWMLWILVFAVFLPQIAIQMGWAATEVGRQPWIVQGLLRTVDGVSPTVSAAAVATTLALFAVVYLLLFIGWVRVVFGIIRKGPEDVATMLGGAAAPEPVPVTTDEGPRPAGAGAPAK